MEDLMRLVREAAEVNGARWVHEQLAGSQPGPSTPPTEALGPRKSRPPERLSPDGTPRARRRHGSPLGDPQPAAKASTHASGRSGGRNPAKKRSSQGGRGGKGKASSSALPSTGAITAAASVAARPGTGAAPTQARAAQPPRASTSTAGGSTAAPRGAARRGKSQSTGTSKGKAPAPPKSTPKIASKAPGKGSSKKGHGVSAARRARSPSPASSAQQPSEPESRSEGEISSSEDEPLQQPGSGLPADRDGASNLECYAYCTKHCCKYFG
ncbi:brain acid soluble protein 1-like [Hyperolius riggenbachi]|uniref:brain acid soluble protein 1-like n=1 Tax=Hyperolius riggenbachi TaxID=752182 RepID=UPI0035A30FB7